MIIVAGLGIVSILVFSGNAPLIEEGLRWLTLVGAGAFGGYGLAKRRN